jgi:hypothetical protein
LGEWSTGGGGGDDDDKPKRKPGKAVPRRSALKSTGIAVSGVLGLAAAGLGAQAYRTGALSSFTEGPGFDPLRAWDAQKTSADLKGKPQGLIAAGLLAASPHNTQPWKFSVRDKIIDVMADDARNLGVIDPRRRELTIGLGCCIENMVLGASAVGVTPLLNMLPEGPGGRTLARFTVYDSAAKPTKESEALARRHTNRGPYAVARQVDKRILDAMEGLVTAASTQLVWLRADSEAGRRFAEGTVKATADFIADAEMVAASDKWFRFEASAHKDGLTLPGVGLSPLMTRIALMVPRGLQGNPHQTWLTMTRDVHVATAPLFGLIAVPALDDVGALMEAGRLWQRLHVQATIMGMAMQPLNQMFEVADRDAALTRPSQAEKTLAGLASLTNKVFCFGFRMGFSRFITHPSPRRGLEDVIG